MSMLILHIKGDDMFGIECVRVCSIFGWLDNPLHVFGRKFDWIIREVHLIFFK